MESKGVRKTVYFGDNEDKLLDYALKQSSNFAAYVKELIKKDMDKEPFESKVIKILEDYLQDKKISVNKSDNKEIKESDYNQDDINALNDFMKNK